MNDLEVATAASKRLKMDGRSILTLQSFINNSLNNLARECANDDYKKRYLMTDPASVTATITSDGTFRYYADLSADIFSPQIMLDYLQYGTIFYVPATQTFVPGGVSGDRISITNHGYQTGLAVQLTTSNALPAPLVAATTYYVIRLSANLFSLATTYQRAVDGIAITLSDTGTGVQTITPWEQYITQWLASPTQGALISSNPFYYPYIWIEQNLLYTDQLKGTFKFNVPFIPNLDNLPSVLQSDLIDEVVKIAITQGFEPTPSR